MDEKKETPDYDVGYGRPPVATRFKRGTSGNPRGKKKGTRSLKADLLDELAESITLREDGRRIRVSKQRAMIKSQAAKGIRGDTRAASKIFDLVTLLFGTDQEIADSKTITAEDKEILERFLRRRAGEGKTK